MNRRLLRAASFRPSLNHNLDDILFVYPSWILKAAWGILKEGSSITGQENDCCGKALLGLSCCWRSITVLLNMSICCWMSLLCYSLSLPRHSFMLKAAKIYSVSWPKYSRWGNWFSCSAGWVVCFFERARKRRAKKRKMYKEQQENCRKPWRNCYHIDLTFWGWFVVVFIFVGFFFEGLAFIKKQFSDFSAIASLLFSSLSETLIAFSNKC